MNDEQIKQLAWIMRGAYYKMHQQDSPEPFVGWAESKWRRAAMAAFEFILAAQEKEKAENPMLKYDVSPEGDVTISKLSYHIPADYIEDAWNAEINAVLNEQDVLISTYATGYIEWISSARNAFIKSKEVIATLRTCLIESNRRNVAFNNQLENLIKERQSEDIHLRQIARVVIREFLDAPIDLTPVTNPLDAATLMKRFAEHTGEFVNKLAHE